MHVHTHLSGATAARRIEVHRSGCHHVGSRQRPPQHSVLDFVDDFRIPFAGESCGSARDSVRMAARRFRDNLDYGTFQADGLTHMNAAFILQRRPRAPTSKSSPPVPSAHHFFASAIVWDGSDRLSASIGMSGRAFCVPAQGIRHHTCFPLVNEIRE